MFSDTALGGVSGRPRTRTVRSLLTRRLFAAAGGGGTGRPCSTRSTWRPRKMCTGSATCSTACPCQARTRGRHRYPLRRNITRLLGGWAAGPGQHGRPRAEPALTCERLLKKDDGACAASWLQLALSRCVGCGASVVRRSDVQAHDGARRQRRSPGRRPRPQWGRRRQRHGHRRGCGTARSRRAHWSALDDPRRSADDALGTSAAFL